MVTQKNVLILFLLGALLLTGCTAVELLENHTSSAYGLGLMYEEGYENQYSPSSSVKKDINRAYQLYLIADKLGDVRAKGKIDSLSKKLSSSDKKHSEDYVVSKSISFLRKFYDVDPKYDHNRNP